MILVCAHIFQLLSSNSRLYQLALTILDLGVEIRNLRLQGLNLMLGALGGCKSGVALQRHVVVVHAAQNKIGVQVFCHLQLFGQCTFELCRVLAETRIGTFILLATRLSSSVFINGRREASINKSARSFFNSPFHV